MGNKPIQLGRTVPDTTVRYRTGLRNIGIVNQRLKITARLLLSAGQKHSTNEKSLFIYGWPLGMPVGASGGEWG